MNADESRVYYRTDISFTIVGDDNVCESLVHRLILSPRPRFVERFRLRTIRNSAVESEPKNLKSAISFRKGMMSLVVPGGRTHRSTPRTLHLGSGAFSIPPNIRFSMLCLRLSLNESV